MFSKILCVCPTYGRPKLVANSLACFLSQTYPTDRCHLLILDDAGQYREQRGPNWQVVSIEPRFPSMPAKYAYMFQLAGILPFRKTGPYYDAVALWDDDDIYLPNHLASHAEQLEQYAWSYPRTVYKLDDPTCIRTENPDGNMWASIAFRSTLLRSIGWPQTNIAAFDLQFLGLLRGGGTHGSSPERNPGRSHNKSFMFRWQSTKHPHLQNFINSPTDTTQYSRFPLYDATYVDELVPQFDDETAKMYDLYSKGEI